MPVAKKTEQSASLDIDELQLGEFKVSLIGETPLILNRVSEKARHELIFPAPRRNAAARASTLKHDPLAEFRASPYTMREGPTLLGVPNEMLKAAICTAALDTPGVTKTMIGRLVSVQGHLLPVYGEPQMLMSVVRSADINRTPDIRTRAIIPEWTLDLTVTYRKPLLTEKAVANLIAAAGFGAGIGDWRQEKGKGSYGRFRLALPTDPAIKELHKRWTRDAQMAALESPVAYDEETRDLYEWFESELKIRGRKADSTPELSEAAGA